MLGPAGEHPVGFVDPAGDKIVDEDADVALLPVGDEGLAPRRGEGSVGSGHDPLCRRLLVAGRAVDLPGQEQAGDLLARERRCELIGGGVVVFHGIAVAHDPGVFEPRHEADHRVLHIPRQARRDPVDIHLLRPPPLRLEEQLMGFAVGEPHHLVFNARAVARPARLDLAAVHRRPVEIGTDQGVDGGIRPRDPAVDLVDREGVGEERESLWIGVARLALEAGGVDRPGGEPARGAGLEALEADAGLGETAADPRRRPLPCPPPGSLRLAGVHDRLEEGAGGEHD